MHPPVEGNLEIRDLESEILLKESRILLIFWVESSIQVPLTKNPESSTWDLESSAWNSGSKTVLDYFIWSNLQKHPSLMIIKPNLYERDTTIQKLKSCPMWAFVQKHDILTHESNMLFSHVKRSPLLWLHNKSRLSQEKNCFSEMVWYFIGVYIINRTLHGRLEIRNFSSCVENKWNIFQHEKRNFVSLCSHVISSIYPWS